MDITALQAACAANKDDTAELGIAYNGRVAAMRAYNDRPGKATKEDYESARDFYQATIDRLQAKYFPDQAPAPEGERFANRKQALNWLNAQGYKVGQDKFYRDCKSGFPQTHRDKTVSRFQVLQYAQQLDVDQRTTSTTDLARRRELAETEKAEHHRTKARIQSEQMQRELDRQWIKREEAELEVCTWAALTRDSIVHRITQALPAIIHAVGGKIDRLAEGQNVIDQAITDACNDIANCGDVEIEVEELARAN